MGVQYGTGVDGKSSDRASVDPGNPTNSSHPVVVER